MGLLAARTVDEVVFGEADDLVLLGCRSLEGLNVRVEPTTRKLVDGRTSSAAAAARASNGPTRVASAEMG